LIKKSTRYHLSHTPEENESGKQHNDSEARLAQKAAEAEADKADKAEKADKADKTKKAKKADKADKVEKAKARTTKVEKAKSKEENIRNECVSREYCFMAKHLQPEIYEHRLYSSRSRVSMVEPCSLEASSQRGPPATDENAVAVKANSKGRSSQNHGRSGTSNTQNQDLTRYQLRHITVEEQENTHRGGPDGQDNGQYNGSDGQDNGRMVTKNHRHFQRFQTKGNTMRWKMRVFPIAIIKVVRGKCQI
jgi:hypothetical protein